MNSISTLIISTSFVLTIFSQHIKAQSSEDLQAKPSELVYDLKQSDELFQLLRPRYIEEFSHLINQVQLKQDTSYALSSATVADSCMPLMAKENFAGSTGSRISQIVFQNKNLFPLLIHGGSVNRYCRNYPVMSLQQKSLVWTLLLTVIAHFESTCNPKAHAKGPNGTAYGYFQQHAGAEQKYDGDMNICRKNSSKDPVLAGQCTLSMLELQFQRERGELFNNNSYWDVLRPNGRSAKASAIQRALTQFSLCHPKLL